MLVSITVRGELAAPRDWLPNVKLLVEKAATATLPWPVPVKVIIGGLTPELPLMTREAVKLPELVGVNVMVIVQLPPAATELPHVLAVTAKSAALLPVIPMLVMVNVALPALVRVMTCAELVVPGV